MGKDVMSATPDVVSLPSPDPTVFFRARVVLDLTGFG